MPLPILLGIGAAIAAAGGVAAGVSGAKDMKKAKKRIGSANERHAENIERFKKASDETTLLMDEIGNMELDALKDFGEFSYMIERIQNRPQNQYVGMNDVTLPQYDPQKLREVSIGAGVLVGGLGGAALGTAGGFAAAGATTAAVMALGTASTGTAIATLTGAAATNATLAALGGGAIAAGGGGVALGTTILGASTLGVGLLVGGVIFKVMGSSVSGKAEEAWRQMESAEAEIDQICDYLFELRYFGTAFHNTFNTLRTMYDIVSNRVRRVVFVEGKTDWSAFLQDERLDVQNSVLLVSLMDIMCQVKLVKVSEGDKNEVNKIDISQAIMDVERGLVGSPLLSRMAGTLPIMHKPLPVKS
ncbi:MAG: hypothetical protein LBT40_16950 [Deltaproteobacteria bacterium]|jgi:hypothetical protein|nr:hypothetical protein [Deltaproteobacteria bacterium]